VILIRIPDTPHQLLHVARSLDRFRAWCEAEGLGWPTLEEEFAIREAQALATEWPRASA